MARATGHYHHGGASGGSPFGPVGGWQSPFVGRAEQLAALESAWSRRRRLVLILGQPGVGKTRLTDEFAMMLRERGTTVVSGRWGSDWLGPYAGFVGPLRQVLSRLDPSEVAGRANWRAWFRSSPRGWLPKRGRAAPDGGVERRLLFEAVAGVLQRLGPVLVLLDDLQWADPDSLALLAYLGGQPLPDLVMLATVRSAATCPQPRRVLWPTWVGCVCDVDRLHLGRLPSTELDLLVRHIAGDAATPELLAAVEAASEGNTFYAEELTEHLLHLTGERSAVSTTHGVPLPERIRDMVGRRVATLSLRVNPAAGRSGAGPRFRSSPRRTAGRTLRPRGDRRHRGTRCSRVWSTRRPHPCSRSPHVLVQATVNDSLSALRRVDLHRRAAMALADDGPSRPETVAQVARHWTVVADIDGSATVPAAYWSVRAGDAALASGRRGGHRPVRECHRPVGPVHHRARRHPHPPGQCPVLLWTGDRGRRPVP